MDARQEQAVLTIYSGMKGWEPMQEEEYKRHLLNHMSYSHAYLSGAGVEIAQANPVALCESAMHAAACAWCLADYHNEATPPEPIPAGAWEGIANRWIKAVEKWSKQLKSNQAAAYQAPIRERNALKEFPKPDGRKAGDGSSGATPDTGNIGAATATDARRSGARSSGQTIDSGAGSADDRAAREAFYAPPAPKRSHKKKPAVFK